MAQVYTNAAMSLTIRKRKGSPEGCLM